MPSPVSQPHFCSGPGGVLTQPPTIANGIVAMLGVSPDLQVYGVNKCTSPFNFNFIIFGLWAIASTEGEVCILDKKKTSGDLISQ